MKHRTVAQMAEKAGLEIKASSSEHRTFYRASKGSKVLMWATHKADPEHAECVTIEGDGYSHNARYAKTVRSFLNS